MSVLWEKLAGDTSEFALKLSIARDPHGGVGELPEVSASWGSFELWVGGVNLSTHSDGGVMVQSSHWYLLPLLEWLAEHWDALLHEERLPATVTASDAAGVSAPWSEMAGFDRAVEAHVVEDFEWRQRHSLRSARAGGLFPGVFFRRSRQLVEVSWQDSPLAGATDVRYAAPAGRMLADPELVAEVIHAVCSEAAQWLAARFPDNIRLGDLVASWSSLADDRQEVRLSWLAGLGRTTAAAVDRWKEMMATVQRDLDGGAGLFVPTGSSPLVVSGSPVAALLFGSLSPRIDDADVLTLMKVAVQRRERVDGELAKHSEDLPPSSLDREIWEEGYDLALDARSNIGLDGESVDMDRLLDRLGVAVVDVELGDASLRAVSMIDGEREPVVAVNGSCSFNVTTGGRRFSLAHELCHLLHDQSFGAPFAIASGPWAPQVLEKRANAFAAMFLMPPELISSAIGATSGAITTRAASAQAAESLEVSYSAFVEHAGNLGLLTDEDRRRLLRQR